MKEDIIELNDNLIFVSECKFYDEIVDDCIIDKHSGKIVK